MNRVRVALLSALALTLCLPKILVCASFRQITGGELEVQDRQICYEGRTVLLFDELPKRPAVVGEGVVYGRLQGSEDDPRFSSASLSSDEKLLVFIVEFTGDRHQWWGTKNLVSGKVREGGVRLGGGLGIPIISPWGDTVLFEDNGGGGSGYRSVRGYYLNTFKPLKINELTGKLIGRGVESFDPHWISRKTIGYKTRKCPDDYRSIVPITSWVFNLNTGEAQEVGKEVVQ